jgi:glycerol transport system ATP-binding protein
MATIELVDVAHAYMPGKYAVKDINLKWEHGINSALLGPSGCGKTTLLKIISGLLQPTEGHVLLNGQEVNSKSPKERNIAQVFQFPVVYETLNVYDNLAFPLRNRKTPESVVKSRVHEIADLIGLSDKLQYNAVELGAAEKQLIALGRGVIREDLAAILLDEPLTVIDPRQKWYLRRKLKQLQQHFQITMIYVTHDQHEALTFADQVTVMDLGVILQTGTPQELHDQPQAPFVGYFIGSPGMNIFDAKLSGNQLVLGNFSIPIPKNLKITGQNLKVGIRPEFIEILHLEQPTSFQCKVENVYLTGPAKILNLNGAGLSFKTRVSDTFVVNPGDTVWAYFPPEWTMIYANDRAVNFLDKEKSV